MPTNFNDNFRTPDNVDRDRESASSWHDDLHGDSVATAPRYKDLPCTGIVCKNNRNPCHHNHCQRREFKGKIYCYDTLFRYEMEDGQI